MQLAYARRKCQFSSFRCLQHSVLSILIRRFYRRWACEDCSRKRSSA